MPTPRFLFLLGALMVLAGGGSDDPTPEPSIPAPVDDEVEAVGTALGDEAEADTASIAVENLRLVREQDGSQTIRGLVVNRADRERSAQVVIALYDGSNQRIDEVQVSVEGIAAEGQQGFSRALDREAAGVSVRRIIGY